MLEEAATRPECIDEEERKTTLDQTHVTKKGSIVMTNKIFGKIIVKTAGTSFENRQGKLWNVRKFMAKQNSIIVMLRREPHNEHDPKAIAVLVKTGKTVAKVGYVPSDIAFWLAPKMDNGLIVRANGGAVTGGSGKAKNLGFTFSIAHEIPSAAAAVEPAIEQ